MSKLKVCLRHISEVFLYEYYCLGDDEYEISNEDTLTPHKEKAKEQLLAGNYSGAQQEWLSAHLENPVDMETILGIILCCKQLGDADGEYSYTTESYNYCCTRAELAAYYRNLGWYYLEKYKPEVAAACYLYSKYFEDSQQADAELEFLEKAIGKKVADKDLDQIQHLQLLIFTLAYFSHCLAALSGFYLSILSTNLCSTASMSSGRRASHSGLSSCGTP